MSILKLSKNLKAATNNKGFTLIEIAIVLVIIGLILGAAVKGKDLIQSAKQKKFYTTFVKSWELVCISYYDRTGNLLGDGTINGGTAKSTNAQFDNIKGNKFGDAKGVDEKIKAVGLTIPTSSTAKSGEFAFKGQFSGSQVVRLSLNYLASATDGNSNNALYLTNMPTDLAIALDTIIDGKMDSTAGSFRQFPDDTGSWPDASTTPTVEAQYIMDIP